MSNEIAFIKPALSVILDDGDFIINSTGPIGKLMAQAILPAVAAARKVTIITDGEMKVMKRSAGVKLAVGLSDGEASEARDAFRASLASNPEANAFDAAVAAVDNIDIQDQFAADLEAGRTGEQATGEIPSPTPGPNDPTPLPAKPPAPTRRKHQIFQDAAAPPAPELAEAEMARLLEEAAQAEKDAVKVAEDQRFQQQQAVQAGAEASDKASVSKPAPRRREPRQLATMGRPCGKCGGSGQTGVMGEGGAVFTGACPVCHGEGQVKTWDRSLKVRLGG